MRHTTKRRGNPVNTYIHIEGDVDQICVGINIINEASKFNINVIHLRIKENRRTPANRLNQNSELPEFHIDIKILGIDMIKIKSSL